MSYNPYQTPQAGYGGRDTYSTASGEITPGLMHIMAGMKTWIVLFAIISFIGIAISVVSMILVPPAGATMVFQVGALALNLALALRIWFFGSALNVFLANPNSVTLAAALRHQRIYWLITGILMILVIVAVVFMMVAGAAVGASRIQ